MGRLSEMADELQAAGSALKAALDREERVLGVLKYLLCARDIMYIGAGAALVAFGHLTFGEAVAAATAGNVIRMVVRMLRRKGTRW